METDPEQNAPMEQPSEAGCVQRACFVRRPRVGAAGLLAMSALIAGSFGFNGGRSSYAERHDPHRPKTTEDLERMEAARLRRERKAAKRKAQNSDYPHQKGG